MRIGLCLFRLTSHVALAATLLDAVLPAASFAQPAPPPLPQPYQAQPSQSQADPPERVGRVAHLGGTVSLRGKGDDQWTQASANYPVSSGDGFWTEPAASAELEIADSSIALAGTTEFDIATLDSNGLQAVAAQGEVYLHLRDLSTNEVWAVQTPRGLVHLNTRGRYLISVGSTEQPTRVTVLDGSAQVDGPGLSLRVESGQTATIDGTTSFQGSVGPEVKDAFLIARLDAERPRPAPPVSIPPQVAVMPGGSDLTGYGSWSEAPDYGQVWYPPVSSGWVPYRQGHWAYVAPWGWTWIDDAPWGFAPFHYGRWIEIGDRWAWTPGVRREYESPVYAPALVSFIGFGAGVALGAALASRSIGWVPLGPREPYHPWYHTSDRYLQAVNISHVTNITNNNVTVNTYVNQHAATAMPGVDMARSRPVQSVAQPLTAQQFAAARPIVGEQPIHPTAETAGLTPAVARAYNVPASALPRAAPGPSLHPQTAGVAGSGFVRPMVASPGPGNPGTNGAPGSRPVPPGHSEVPALVSPGARPTAVPVPVVPVPQAGRAPQPLPAEGRRAEPMTAAPASAAVGGRPEPAMHAEPRPSQQTVLPPHSEQQHFAPPPHVAVPALIPGGPQHIAPRQEPPHVAAAPPRAEPPHFAAPPPRLEPQRIAPPPRLEPQRIAVPPHLEPQRIAAPAPRPEPPHVAPAPPRPAPEREKRPGER